MAVSSANILTVAQTRADNEAREYTVTWLVETTDPLDGPITVRASLPALGTSLAAGNDSDAEAYVTGYGSIANANDPQEDRKQWRAEVRYSTMTRRKCDDDLDLGPLSEPPVIRGGADRGETPAVVDNAGNPIVNSAGNAFDDLLADDSNQRLTIAINQATLDLDTLDDFTDAVNDSAFFGLGARKWKMDPPTWEERYYGACIRYFAVTYSFRSRRETWDLKPLDRGFLDQNGKFPADSETGMRGVTPANLDGAGEFLAAGGDLVFFDGVGGNPDPFTYYPERDFGSLGIPTGF